MAKAKTHFPQVPVEVAKRIAEVEFSADENVSDALEQAKKKKGSNGDAAAGRNE